MTAAKETCVDAVAAVLSELAFSTALKSFLGGKNVPAWVLTGFAKSLVRKSGLTWVVMCVICHLLHQ